MHETFADCEDAMFTCGRALSSAISPGDVVCFSGELGAGKTTLIKAIISSKTGCARDQVTSPTFTYVHEYGEIAHFDLYRLTDPGQFSGMGFDEYFSDDRICLIEWPERLQGQLPKHNSVHIEHCPGGRKIQTTLGGTF